MNYPDTKTGGAQAVRRAMEIVRTVAQIQRSGASLSRMARATGLHNATAHRLLRSLTEERMLVYDTSRRHYAIGPLAYELGLAAAPEAWIDKGWRDVVAEVAGQTRLTSYLIGQSGDEAVCLHCIQGSAAIRAMPMEVGQRVPLGFGAGSLAILASLDDAEIARIIATHHDRYEQFPGGAHPTERILDAVAETRQRGFSLSAGTVSPGVVGLGVLACAEEGSARFAVTVSAVASEIGGPEAARLAAIISDAIRGRRAGSAR